MMAVFHGGKVRKNFYFSQEEFLETISLCFNFMNMSEGYKASLNQEGLKDAFSWMNSGLRQYHHKNGGYIPEDSATWVSAIALTSCVLNNTIDFKTPVGDLKEMKIDIFYRVFLVLTIIDTALIEKKLKSPRNIYILNHTVRWDETKVSEAIDILSQQSDTNEMILAATNLMRSFIGRDNVDYPNEYLLPEN